MGKSKKGGKKKGRGDSDEDDDASIMSLAGSSAQGGSDGEEGNLIVDAIERLTEKRSSHRESSLASLVKHFQHHYDPESLEDRVETLLSYLKISMRKGTAKEGLFAAQLLKLVFLTVGPEMEGYYEETADWLKLAIKDHKNTGVRAAASEALATACFVSCSMREDTVDCADFLSSLWSNKSPPVLISSCMESWGVVFTTLTWGYVAANIFREALPDLSKFLEHEDLDVRISAGELIALLYEVMYSLADDENSDLQMADIDISDSLRETLGMLAKDGNRHRGKKERNKQRFVFREIQSMVEDGEYPSEKLKNKSDTIYFESFAQIHQLENLRECFGTGFDVHLTNNELVRDIFDLGPPPEVVTGKGGRNAKRMGQLQNQFAAKMRGRERGNQRASREAGRQGDSNYYDE